MMIRVAIICLIHLASIKAGEVREEPIIQPDIPVTEPNQAIERAKQQSAALLQNQEYQRVLSSIMNDAQANAFLNTYQSGTDLTQEEIQAAYNSFDTTFKNQVSLEQFNEFLQGEQIRRQALQALKDAQKSKTTDETTAQTKTPITLPDQPTQPSNQIDETGLVTKAKEKSFWTELYESIAAFFKAGSLGQAYTQLETQQTEIMRLARNLTEAQQKQTTNNADIQTNNANIEQAQKSLEDALKKQTALAQPQTKEEAEQQAELEKQAVDRTVEMYKQFSTSSLDVDDATIQTQLNKEKATTVEEVKGQLVKLKEALDKAQKEVLKLQNLYQNPDLNKQEIQECIKQIKAYNTEIHTLVENVWPKFSPQSNMYRNVIKSINNTYNVSFGTPGILDVLINTFNADEINAQQNKEDIEYFTKKIAELKQKQLALQATAKAASKSIQDNQQRIMYEFNEIFKDLSANQRAELRKKINLSISYSLINGKNFDRTFLSSVLNDLSPAKP